MNDNGKTVSSIQKIRPTYRRVGKGGKQYRCIELSLQLVLPGTTEPAGLEGTLRTVDTVTNRALKALAEEFLP